MVVAVLVLWPASARAWTAPGQHPATGHAITLMTRARDFWAARSVIGCANGITVWQAPSLAIGGEPAWELGSGVTCEMWVSDDLAASLDPEQRESIDTLVDACTAIAHGTGHALGLEHTPAGVMAGGESKPPWPHAWAPYFCVVWAQEQTAARQRLRGVSEKSIRHWARADRERILHPHPQKGVLRSGQPPRG